MTLHIPYSTRPGLTLASVRAYRLRSVYRTLRASLGMSASAAYGVARLALS